MDSVNPIPSESTATPLPSVPVRKGVKRVIPQTLSPTLRILLFLIFASVGILGASGAYLSAVSILDYIYRPTSYATTFTLWMFLAHGGVGLAIILPFMLFGFWHLIKGYRVKNPAAIRRGLWLFGIGLIICFTGVALFQLEGLPQLPTGTLPRSVTYWLHVALPVGSIFLYVAHRRKGPTIRWRYAKLWAGGVAAFVGGMVVLHSQTPHRWFAEGPKDGEAYFHPSEARTADGKFIPQESLLSDTYCMQCHESIYKDHLHSSHKFSSFNNPAYLASVKETRDYATKRDGNVQASRWCAGCHDPAPFFSGAFDDPNFDMEKHPTAHAGITCVACHSITHVHGVTGNASYTIESPDHYPFAFSSSSSLQQLSNQVIKAKPDVHKKTFLKPFHKTAEFCSTCHKVSLPVELNQYKDFLRGQNHYDSYLVSGVSGHGARSFYYPPKAAENCAACHMNLKPSNDFGAKDFDGSGIRKNHNHLFPAANTGLPALLKNEPRYAHLSEGLDEAIKTHTDYLTGVDPTGKDQKVRIDIFGIKDGATTDPAKLIAPLRPQMPKLVPGKSYIVEVVVRTLGVGHHFSQGTVDSNEIWVDFQAKTGDIEIARNGALSGPNDTGTVDKWAHFINVLMLDRNGNRINRRNPQDIFTPLYDHQIPPGAAAVMHYRVDIPATVSGPIELNARLRYRKFDHEYMKYIYGDKPMPTLPIVDMCSDKLTLPVVGVAETVPVQKSAIKAGWQRWNDYGIANLLEGGAMAKLGNYKQAEAAFQKLVTLGVKDAVSHGHMNLARVYVNEGRLEEAATQLDLASKADPAPPWWTHAWLTAVVTSENATRADQFDLAIAELEKIIDPSLQDHSRGFDFSKDYVILNLLANRLYKRRLFEPDGSPSQREFVLKAIRTAEKVLVLDTEDVQAHDLLKQAYSYFAKDDLESDDSAPLADLNVVAMQVSRSDLPLPERQQAAAALSRTLKGIGKRESQPGQPKLLMLRQLAKILRPAFDPNGDPALLATVAGVFTALHQELHGIYKPDDVARSEAARIYRTSHPEANYASRVRVVYPTRPEHRATILGGGELIRD